MSSARRHIVLLLMLLLSLRHGFAQKTNNLSIQNDHLILLIDLHGNKMQIDSILRVSGIPQTKIDQLLKGDYAPLKKDGWNISKLNGSMVQLDLPLSQLAKNPQYTPFQVTVKLNKTENRPGYPAEVLYGVNKFSRPTVFELPSGLTRFYLPGNLNVRRVMLSGSFNDWSTGQGQMTRTDSGWVRDIKIEPGKYAYKYIVNGNWTTDPNNSINEDDGAGNTNSIYFRYNYTFKLTGYKQANRVVIAGSFNKWNQNELTLQRTADGWQRRLFLHDGMYTYRFMVDGQWIADPLNPDNKKDASGEVKSPLNLGETVTFKLDGYPNAKQVYVAGDFNGWKYGELEMQRSGNSWIIPYTFAAGNYQYKFTVDGRWITDPLNPHQVVSGGQSNSFVAVKPNHTFHLKGYTKARTVRISGNLNNWAEDGYTLARDGDGWTVSLRLKPGKCIYKFIVDGNWVLDNTNKQWEQNEFGTGNSVLWVQ